MKFPTTSWSVVLAAKAGDDLNSREALERLCQDYWFPVYGYIRGRGASPDRAQDLTQGFFFTLLDKDSLHAIEAPRGRFRWFLLAAVKNYLANQYDREQALKRGGGLRFLSLDADRAERMYLREPADTSTPETLFDRRWSMLLLDRALERLRIEHRRSGKDSLFETLKAHLIGEGDAGSYRHLAESLGTTEGAVRVAVHRMRRQFAEVVRAEIAETVEDSGEIDEELRFLMNALR